MHLDQLTQLAPFNLAQHICCYVALPDEVETRPIIESIWQRGVTVSAPKIIGSGQMVAVVIQSWADVAPGRFGILEPRNAAATDQPFDSILVPGRVFTIQGQRQGRGHGYYDRFLFAHPEAVRIGVCWESQLVETLSTKPHDEPMDWIVTEHRAVKTEAR